MIKKSTRISEKVKDVEVDMIERSIPMKEGAKTKIQDKLIVLRKAHFEKAQSKDKQKFKRKELVLQYFCSVSKVHIGKGTWCLPTVVA